MKYLLFTKDSVFKNVFPMHFHKKKIVFETVESVEDFQGKLAQRGKKTIFIDHSTSFEGFDLFSEFVSKNAKENIIISFGDELSGDEVAKLFRLGLADLFVSPFSPEDVINRAIVLKKQKSEEKKIQIEEKEGINSHLNGKYVKPIGKSSVFKSLLMLVERIAKSDATILITGESGTGKEVLANYIHHLSERKENVFVPVNCGAIPENLLESEMFGHVKGSFTGAFTDRIGRFELASNGTIFLDEVGELPLLLQVKLLRVLQEKEIQPVGSNEIRSINPRIIVATNRSLEKEVKEGNFREDLFYRLNVIPIHIPALRDRKEDIEILAEKFIEKFNKIHSKNIKGIDKKTLDFMMDYEWKGNIRELENTIERMVVIKSDGFLTPEDLPPKILGIDADPMALLLGTVNLEDKIKEKIQHNQNLSPVFDLERLRKADIPENFNLKEFLEEFEKIVIEKALEKSNGNKNNTAKMLGLNRTTLIEKIKKKNIK